MPTYEYECPKGHLFEAFQKMTDEAVAKCPECGKAARRKISGGAGFLFKGEGFYVTDYRSEAYKKRASSESGEAPTASTPKGGESGSSSKVEGGSASAKSSEPKSDA